jgi:hypothetical protein
MNDEFYIGWEDKAPLRIGQRSRGTVLLLLALAIVLGVALSLAQRTIGVSAFEWGKVKGFTGILKSQPYPHLLVPRPGAGEFHTLQSVKSSPSVFSSYYLVKPFKFGLDSDTANQWDGKAVSLKGTLIYRGGQTMIEVAADSIRASDSLSSREGERAGARGLSPKPIRLGQQTLLGEIVDSKCYLGVMNPGSLIPHRACAIRCISGGIPPVLLVRQTNGSALYFLLVSRDGKPVNKQVLNLVAEPVEVTGEVERQGDLLILRADPATYRRVNG